MFATCMPSWRASSRPRSVRSARRDGSPFTRCSRLRTDSACRAMTKRRTRLSLDDDLLFTQLSAGEAVEREGGQVERRLLPRHELGEVLADGGTLLEAVPGKAGGVQESARLARLADDGVVIGAHLVVPPPRCLDRQVVRGGG